MNAIVEVGTSCGGTAAAGGSGAKKAQRFRTTYASALACLCLCVCWSAGNILAQDAGVGADVALDYARDVQPILTRCYTCHGPEQQTNGLRLDRRADALRGGHSGPAIVPGRAEDSKLIKLVSGEVEGLVMPPVGDRLSPREIGILRSWIDQGARWSGEETALGSDSRAQPEEPSHWAFQAPVKPPLPAALGVERPLNPIDYFVRSRLEEEGLAPSPQADRVTLIRRLCLDLIGLPPTPDEVGRFLDDQRPDAYERLVDQLLSSPHFGEKWARHWLDLARYADSDGFETDLPRPHAWRYRQWVIEAFNRNMPFDQFTIEQIAGDLLPDATLEQRIATGFHRNTLTNREGGTNPAEFRFEQIVDRTNTAGTVWLGLSVGCAQCHDHKYDPLSQREYYQLFGFFDATEEIDAPAPLPSEVREYRETAPGYYRKRRQVLKKFGIPAVEARWERGLLRAALQPGQDPDWDRALGLVRRDGGGMILLKDAAERTDREKELMTSLFLDHYRWVADQQELKRLRFSKLRKKLKKIKNEPALSLAQTVEEGPYSPKTHVHLRGDFRRTGIEVRPATPAFLHAGPAEARPNRLSLARWLVSRENPLTARVTVNRIWQELFGRGLVFSSDNFGIRGEKPSHPKLLDWLAVEFMDHGWNYRHMIKLMVTSATYRQSSKIRPQLEERDPDNILLARQSRLRLAAEVIRDSTLAVGGLLHTEIGGKSVRPPQPKGITDLSYANNVKWEESRGADRYRRGLYIHFQRTVPYPQLVNFDAPDSNNAACRRERSNTPLQALNLLNDPVFLEAAQGLARRVLREASAEFDQLLDYAFRLCLARPPTARETGRLRAYFQEQKAILEKEPGSIDSFVGRPVEGEDRLPAAAWVGVARVLMNLEEFITRE